MMKKPYINSASFFQEFNSMQTQLEYLQNEIDKITLDNIENNNDPLTISAMFKTISENIEAIRKCKKPYRTKDK